jgi:hypothetical protein
MRANLTTTEWMRLSGGVWMGLGSSLGLKRSPYSRGSEWNNVAEVSRGECVNQSASLSGEVSISTRPSYPSSHLESQVRAVQGLRRSCTLNASACRAGLNHSLCKERRSS